jgi:hypothetical protein
MKRQGRKTVEEKVTSVEGVEIIALTWYDNKPVHLVSSFAGAYPTSTVRRWDRKEKKSIQVQCPSAIMTYSVIQKRCTQFRTSIFPELDMVRE